jgi:hypothetical protein
MSRVIEIEKTLRANSVGCCIYCGATKDLTDEHIIPLALGGNYVLPDASCIACAAITSEFEGRVLRGFMLDARTVGDYPTRHAKKRPTSLPLRVERSGIFEQVDLPPKEHPGLLHLPIFEPPDALTGRRRGTGVSVCGAETLYFGKNPAAVAQSLDVKTIRFTVNWDITSFARLLAKIGYSYAVSSVGLLPRACVSVLPLILGTVDDASHWLGSAQFKLTVESKNPTHALAYAWVPDRRDSKSRFLVVRVKLFVPSGATGYEIVVYRSTEITAA